MYKRVVVEEAQGVSEIDYERLGTFPQRGLELLGLDALVAGLYYAGMMTVMADSVNVQIAAGRVYDGGKMFASETVQERSLAAFVPTTAGQSVICLVVGQGQEKSDDLENRYYERPIDPQNPDAGTQQTVADGYRTRNRQAVLTIQPGIEAARPVAPTAPIGAVAIAEILVTTSGIQSITMRTDTRMMRLEEVVTRQKAIVALLDVIQQTVEGLRADQAGIKAELRASASKTAIASLQVDMALMKDRLDIGDDGSPYWADRFLDYYETDYDPVTDTGHPDFKALVEEGIRFPYAAVSEAPLSLYNPNDPNLMHATAGIICPRYTPVEGIAVLNPTSDMALGGVTSASITVEHLTESRERTRYGDQFTICNNSAFWQSGKYDPIEGVFTSSTGETYKAAAELADWGGGVNHQIIRLQQYWTDTIDVPYDKYTANEVTLNGVIKAWSFLQHQERWTPRHWLAIKSWGVGASITAVLCECSDNGMPDLSRALVSTTKAAADFKVWPERTYFTLDKPRFLAPIAGSKGKAKSYAIAYFTTGDVQVATADGSTAMTTNLWITTDGVAFDIDQTKDIVAGVDFCSFDITQIPVRLQGWNLGGGILGVDILAPAITPAASNSVYEVNVNGTWKALSAANSQSSVLNGVTSFYDARVTLTGTQWAMPIIEMENSRVRLTRPDDDFTWIGPGDADGLDGWAIGSAAAEIELTAVIGAWDAARHALTAKCLSGAGFATSVTAAAPVVTTVPGREVGRPDQESAVQMVWTFTLPTHPTAVKFRLEGTTNNVKIPFHVEWAAARKAS